jgi:hypothetical protein
MTFRKLAVTLIIRWEEPDAASQPDVHQGRRFRPTTCLVRPERNIPIPRSIFRRAAFPAVGVLGVAWMRIASAAAIFASWTKPWRTIKAADRRTRFLLIGLGACLAIMNTSFYLALDRLRMSLVAAMEFAIHKPTAPEAPVQELASTVP